MPLSPTSKPRVRSALRRCAALERAKEILRAEADPDAPDADGLSPRQRVALDLRGLDRFAYRDIASAVGVSIKQARRYVADGLALVNQLTEETAAEVRALDVAMLDEMQSVLMEKMRDGNIQACAQLIKIQLRRDRMLGLAKTDGHEEENENDVVDWVAHADDADLQADAGLAEAGEDDAP